MLTRLILTAVAALSLFTLAASAKPAQDAQDSNRARPAPSTELPPAPELPPAVPTPTPNRSGGGMGVGMGVGAGTPAERGLVPAPGRNGGYGGPIDYDRPFHAAQVTVKPVITSKPEPGFPEEARRNNVAGLVRLRAVLSKDGKVTNISVVKGLPDGLTEKAIAAARKIKFRPAQKEGRAVSMYVTLEYNFVLKDDD
jgi:TonB family protein